VRERQRSETGVCVCVCEHVCVCVRRSIPKTTGPGAQDLALKIQNLERETVVSSQPLTQSHMKSIHPLTPQRTHALSHTLTSTVADTRTIPQTYAGTRVSAVHTGQLPKYTTCKHTPSLYDCETVQVRSAEQAVMRSETVSWHPRPATHCNTL